MINPADGRAWYAPQRVDEDELLDLGLATPEATRVNLDEMWRLNRWLGGFHAITRHLYPRLLAARHPVTLLDIGTGGGQIPGAIHRWAARHSLPVHIVALDLKQAHLKIARDNTPEDAKVHFVQADAAHLPFAPGSVDYVISSLFLHHLSPTQVTALLRSAYTCARRGLIVSDLTRSRLAANAFRLLRPVLHPITYHDGLVSIRRAYLPGELAEFANDAGLRRARVHPHFPGHMTLVADQ